MRSGETTKILNDSRVHLRCGLAAKKKKEGGKSALTGQPRPAHNPCVRRICENWQATGVITTQKGEDVVVAGLRRTSERVPQKGVKVGICVP